MGSLDTVSVNDDNATTSAAAAVSCSICLDLVADHGERSIAKLQCGHDFHLDCIGSAFNMKGVMQCPNCRKVEKGGWLFANGSAPSIAEISEEDWIPDEDPHDLSYSEMPFGVPWCPFGGFTVHSAFEEVESLSSTSSSSMTGSYFAYFRPIPAAISNSNENLEDPNFSHRLNGQSGHSEVYGAHAFPTTYIPHQGWVRHSPPLSATRSYIDSADQASAHPPTHRSSRVGSDAMARSGSFVHPFRYSQGNPRLHGRIQVSHTNHHRQQASNIPSITSSMNPGFRRFSFTRALPLVMPSNRSGGFYVLPPSGFSGRTLHEPVNPFPNHHVHAWGRNQSRFPVISFDRDSGWGPLHATGGPDQSNQSRSSWLPQ